jgi:hypothetical protein
MGCGASSAAAADAVPLTYADATVAHTWGGWTFVVDGSNKDYLFAFHKPDSAGGVFAWKIVASNNGWVDVYDGAAEKTEYSGGTLGVTAVQAATHGRQSEACAAAAQRPQRAVLASPGDTLLHGHWTLTRQADGSVRATNCERASNNCYVIEPRQPGLKHWVDGKLVAHLTLAGTEGQATAAAKAAPPAVAADPLAAELPPTADATVAHTWGDWTFVVDGTDKNNMFALHATGFAWKMVASNNGWVRVYSGGDELTEYATKSRTLGVMAVQPATHGDPSRVRDAAAQRPQRAVLTSLDDALVHGNWTLKRQQDGTVQAQNRLDDKKSQITIQPHVAGLKVWVDGKLVTHLTLGQAPPNTVRPMAAAADASVAHTWGSWTFAVTANYTDELFALHGDFVWRTVGSSGGWIGVYDGAHDALTEYSGGSLGVLAVQPTTYSRVLTTREAVAKRPSRAILTSRGSSFVHGMWTLSLQADGSVRAHNGESNGENFYIIEPHEQGLKHWVGGQLVAHITLAGTEQAAPGAKAAAAPPAAAGIKATPDACLPADASVTFTWGGWTLVVADSSHLFVLIDGFAFKLHASSNGWIDVYDGDGELTESGVVGSLGTRTVRPTTKSNVAAARASAANRPQRAVLSSAADTLVHGNWTLRLQRDGTAWAQNCEREQHYVIEARVPALKLVDAAGKVVMHLTLEAAKAEANIAAAAAAAQAQASAAAFAAAAQAAAAASKAAKVAQAEQAAQAEKAAAQEKAQKEKEEAAVPADLAAWLSSLSLAPFGAALCTRLGVAALADVVHVDDGDLESIAMLPVQRKKFLREAEKVAAAALPKPVEVPPPAPPAPAPAPALPLARVRALVVGCDAYGPPLSRLVNPVSDAAALGAALRGLPGASVTVLHNPGRAELLRALRDFSDPPALAGGSSRSVRVTPAGAAAAAAAATATSSPLPAASDRLLGLFIFSGHGLQVNGVNFLVPSDFALPANHPRLDDVEDGCVALDEVLRKMRYGGFFVSALALDCCRNVPDFLPNAHKSAAGGGALGRGMAAIAAVPPADGDGGGTLVAFATAAGDVALDASSRAPAHSPFAAALLSFLAPARTTTAAAAPAAPALLSLTTHLVSEVRADTRGKQVPYTNMSLSKEAGELRLWVA